jgi:DNA polymerase-4
VAPNKLLAKMASEFHKPNGISIVHETDLQTLIWPLPCRKINGIGPKTDARCRRWASTPSPSWRRASDLADRGSLATAMAPGCMRRLGRDDRPVVTESEPCR